MSAPYAQKLDKVFGNLIKQRKREKAKKARAEKEFKILDLTPCMIRAIGEIISADGTVVKHWRSRHVSGSNYTTNGFENVDEPPFLIPRSVLRALSARGLVTVEEINQHGTVDCGSITEAGCAIASAIANNECVDVFAYAPDGTILLGDPLVHAANAAREAKKKKRK